jgi:hypothetical protein
MRVNLYSFAYMTAPCTASGFCAGIDPVALYFALHGLASLNTSPSIRR